MIDINLTPRQREAAGLLCLGLSNVDIATLMNVKDVTVWTYIFQISEKVGASNRTETALRLVGHLK